MDEAGDDVVSNEKSPARTGAPAAAPAEAELLRRLRTGDELAFAELVRANAPRMLSVARRFMGQESDAQDVVQEAFVSAFRALDKFSGDSTISTWLHRITVNAALMRLRKRTRRNERHIDDLLPQFLDDGHMADARNGWQSSPDEAVATKELRSVVRESIDQLPDSYRSVLLLRDIEQHSTEETAELMNISTSAVKTRLHRARLALRTLLDPCMRGSDQ